MTRSIDYVVSGGIYFVRPSRVAAFVEFFWVDDKDDDGLLQLLWQYKVIPPVFGGLGYFYCVSGAEKEAQFNSRKLCGYRDQNAEFMLRFIVARGGGQTDTPQHPGVCVFVHKEK